MVCVVPSSSGGGILFVGDRLSITFQDGHNADVAVSKSVLLDALYNLENKDFEKGVSLIIQGRDSVKICQGKHVVYLNISLFTNNLLN